MSFIDDFLSFFNIIDEDFIHKFVNDIDDTKSNVSNLFIIDETFNLYIKLIYSLKNKNCNIESICSDFNITEEILYKIWNQDIFQEITSS